MAGVSIARLACVRVWLFLSRGESNSFQTRVDGKHIPCAAPERKGSSFPESPAEARYTAGASSAECDRARSDCPRAEARLDLRQCIGESLDSKNALT